MILAVTLSIFASFEVNKLAIPQKHRIVFCLFIYATNSILLGLTKFLVMKYDVDPNPLVPLGALFELQTTITVVNSTGGMFANFLTFQWPGFTELPEDQVGDYVEALASTALEAFVFFWTSTVISQGLRLSGDTFGYVIKKLHPEVAHAATKVAFLTHLTPEALYGTSEEYGVYAMGYMFAVSFGWINIHIMWLTAVLFTRTFPTIHQC